MFIAQRSEILKAVEGKIGEVYDACFGKREYWPAQCLARAKVKWGSWKNGDQSSVKQTYIYRCDFSFGDGTEDGKNN